MLSLALSMSYCMCSNMFNPTQGSESVSTIKVAGVHSTSLCAASTAVSRHVTRIGMYRPYRIV